AWRAAVQHRACGGADAAQRDPRARRHRADAQRGEPELHRLLAIRSEPRGVARRDGRGVLHRHRRRRGCRRPGAHHRHLPALQDGEPGSSGFDEGIERVKRKKHRPPKFLQAVLAGRSAEPSVSFKETVVSQASIHAEVAHIINSARSGITRVVGLGSLVLFSTQTGDAWMLDPDDEFALCLMKDGEPKPCEINETDTKFAIQWTGRYRIEGSLFA